MTIALWQGRQACEERSCPLVANEVKHTLYLEKDIEETEEVCTGRSLH